MKLTDTEKSKILKKAADLYGFDINSATEVSAHEGGRNVVFVIRDDSILRISTLTDRTVNDYNAEIEYVHFLKENEANVADSIVSKNGNRLEIINGTAVSMFELAKGDQIADHGYQYREGIEIEEYFYNTGKTLGKIHALSKIYKPQNKRFDFFDKYNEEYFDTLIPDDFMCMKSISGRDIKNKFHKQLEKLRQLNIDEDNYGMVHFDYSDGNYNIEYDTGKINVFDFDNCRTCWYMFDIANLWSHGLGWIAWNSDPSARQNYMKSYMQTVIEGYRSECSISEQELDNLELMVNTVLMENIVDDFEVMKANGETLFFDEEKSFNVKCFVDGIPWIGFYSDLFDVEMPFEVEI